MKKITALTAFAGVAALTLGLSACTGAAPGSAGSDSEIRYLISQPETAEQLDLIQQDLKTFEKESGIKVKLDVLPNDNLKTVIQTQLQSGNGPDIFDYGTGPGFSGVLADAGLLYDLTDDYASRDWPVYDFAKERISVDGKIVGIPANVEEYGIYYNKKIFADLGIDEPESIADLTAAAEKIKASGIVPIVVADKEGWEGGHLLSMALSSRIGGDKMAALLAGKSSWDSPDVVAALDVWSNLNDAGLLAPSPTAVSYDSGNSLFYSGEAAMVPTGSWLVAGMEKSAPFDVGFIPFPAEGNRGIYSGGLGSGTFISERSEKKESALKLLDYLVSADRGRWQVQNLHTIPAYPVDTTGIDVGPLFAQVLESTGEITSGAGDFGVNIDVLTTDAFNKAMWDGVQGLLSGQRTSEEVAAALQDAFTQTAK